MDANRAADTPTAANNRIKAGIRPVALSGIDVRSVAARLFREITANLVRTARTFNHRPDNRFPRRRGRVFGLR